MNVQSALQSAVAFLKKNAQLAILFAKGAPDVRTYYNVRNRETIFGDAGPSLNFGYWANQGNGRPATVEAANFAMYDLVSGWATLAPDHKVLDAGCGFGLADAHFVQKFNCSVTGLNLSEVQLQACEQLKSQSLGELAYVHGSATQMPFPDASFDRAFSIEAALHFDPREAFFTEALRVLKPGGRLVIADMVFPEARTLLQQMNLFSLKRGCQVPASNVYDAQRYVSLVKQAGWDIVHTESIAKDVYKPFREWAMTMPQNLLSCSPVLFASVMFMFFYPLDYILVVADKPR